MKDSFKTKLLEELKQRKYMTFSEMESICKANSKKTSNGEKRFRDLRSKYLQGVLNPDYDDQIGIVENPRHAIIAYTYGLKQSRVMQTQNPEWCNSCGGWLTHDRNCEKTKETTNQLF